jgi:hypothetical protein
LTSKSGYHGFFLCNRVLGEAGATAGMGDLGADSSCSGTTTVAASASATPRRWARATRERGGIAAGAQRREPRWQQGVDPRMGFAPDHAEQTPVHHLEGVGLEGDQNEQEPVFRCREGQLW